MRHLVSTKELTKLEVASILDLAARLEKESKQGKLEKPQAQSLSADQGPAHSYASFSILKWSFRIRMAISFNMDGRETG